MKRALLTTALAFALGMVSTTTADELEAAQKQIISKFRDHKSVSAKVAKKTEKKDDANEIKWVGDGTYEFVQRGEKSLYRFEMTDTMDITGKVKLSIKTTTLEVNDGDVVNTYQDRSMGGKQVTKSRPDPMKGWNVPAMLEALNKDFNLKLLPEAKVGETDVFVIEATPKVPKVGNTAKKTRYSFAKDSGVLMREAKVDDKDQESETLTFSDVKLNEKIDPDRFKFTAPDGVKVNDNTGSAKPKP